MSTDTQARIPSRGLTPADRVTVLRAVLSAGCAVLVALTFAGVLPSPNWWLFLLAVPTAVLDAVDGAVARRTGTETKRGARWDMEVDSAFVLVLSVAVAPIAAWALLIGAARYLFWVAGRLRPQLREPLAFRQSRRLIAAFQAAALVAALAPFLPSWAAQGVIAVALALLVFSFGRDVVALERQAH